MWNQTSAETNQSPRAKSLLVTAVLRPNWPQLWLDTHSKVLLLCLSAPLTKLCSLHWEKRQVENAAVAQFVRAACPFCFRTTWFPTSSFISGKWVLSSPRAGCAPTSLLLRTTKCKRQWGWGGGGGILLFIKWTSLHLVWLRLHYFKMAWNQKGYTCKEAPFEPGIRGVSTIAAGDVLTSVANSRRGSHNFYF